MKTINLKSQAELERAELEQQIESFINKKKELMNFYNEVLSSEKLLIEKYELLLTEINQEVDKINDHVKLF
jgi:CRISPR/Cas system-associated protein Cas7 (RAMP superfamily)